MPGSNVYRKESTRWVAPKTSYDGDDWGDEYDEWEGEQSEHSELSGIQEDNEQEVTPPKAALNGKSISVRRRPVGDTVNKEQEVKEKEMKEKELKEKELEEQEMSGPILPAANMSPAPAFSGFKSPSTPVVSSGHDTASTSTQGYATGFTTQENKPSSNNSSQDTQRSVSRGSTDPVPEPGRSVSRGSADSVPEPGRSVSRGSADPVTEPGRSVSHGSADHVTEPGRSVSRESADQASEPRRIVSHESSSQASEPLRASSHGSANHFMEPHGTSRGSETHDTATHRSEPGSSGSETHAAEMQGSDPSSNVGTRDIGLPYSMNIHSKSAHTNAPEIPPLTSSADTPSSPEFSRDPQADSDSDNSIADIYGFYENRYSLAIPEEAGNHYSDSTTSLSTGIRSFDSIPANDIPLSERNGSVGTQRSIETHWEQPQEDYHNNYQEDLQESPEEEAEIPKIAGLNLTKHTPQASIDTKELSSNELSSKEPSSKEPSSKEPSSKEQPNKDQPSPSSSLASTSLHERPYSQFFDEDLAELYNGSSEFLNRPISTYNAPPIASQISSDSIRELLTPRLQQEGFSSETPTAAKPEPSDEAHIPSLFVTSASPEKTGRGRAAEEPGYFTSKTRTGFENDHDYVDEKPDAAVPDEEDKDEEEEEERASEKSHLGKQPEQFEETKPLRDFTHDLDYVDKEDEGDDQDDYSDSSLHRAVSTEPTNAQETFILPSERNRMASLNSLSTPQNEERTSETESVKEPAKEQANELTKEKSRELQTPSDSAATAAPESHALPNSPEPAAPSPFLPSQSPFLPGQQPFAPLQPPTSPIPSSTQPPVKPPHTTERTPQSISAKVKRPPHVDFGALINNNNVSSETLCEQMRLLRNREAAYSAGLETWLLATLRNVDPNMKVYTNGHPPAGDSTLLDLPAAAKMSNAMHTSASKTQEKLGNFGEKSKSFFAKVIR